MLPGGTGIRKRRTPNHPDTTLSGSSARIFLRGRQQGGLDMDGKMAIFKGKNIRRTLHKNEWFFLLADICGALTDSVDAGRGRQGR